MPRELPLPQAAKELAVDTQTLHRWRKRRLIDAQLEGRVYQVNMDSVDPALVQRAHSQRAVRWEGKPVQPEVVATSEVFHLRELLARRDAEVSRLHQIIAELVVEVKASRH